jgi:hypothetical protein
MFLTRAPNLMARIGVDLLCSTQESNETARIAFELPSESNDVDNYYGNIDFFDKWSSTDDWTEEQQQSEEDSDDNIGELCFRSHNNIAATNYKMNQNTWLDDSAASAHMGFSDEGMTDVKSMNSPVQIGNGKTLTATKIGKHHIMIIQKDGSTLDTIMYPCS